MLRYSYVVHSKLERQQLCILRLWECLLGFLLLILTCVHLMCAQSFHYWFSTVDFFLIMGVHVACVIAAVVLVIDGAVNYKSAAEIDTH